MRPRPARVSVPRSGFAGFRFPPEVITLAVRWYLRFGLSYRDVEELLLSVLWGFLTCCVMSP
jgi:IS6 family transposase